MRDIPAEILPPPFCSTIRENLDMKLVHSLSVLVRGMFAPALVAVTLAVLFLPQGLRTQGHRTKSSVDSLAAVLGNGMLTGPFTGTLGHNVGDSAQYARYQTLCRIASTEKLRALTKDKNIVVRAYAFDALAERGTPNLYPLIRPRLQDKTRIKVYSADAIMKTSFGAHLQRILEAYFMGLKPTTDSAHDALRLIALKEHQPGALVAVAKYRRDADTTDILDYINSLKSSTTPMYRCIIEFPSPAFYPHLDKIVHNLLKNSLPSADLAMVYQALVQYKTQQCLDLLRLALIHDKRGVSARLYVHMALKKYPDAYFDVLNDLLKLTEEELRAEKMFERYGNG